MKERWIIIEELSLKDRELLFITAEAAGLRIFKPTRDSSTQQQFPYLIFDGTEVFSTRNNDVGYGTPAISYNTVMSTLRQVIKQNSNKMWNEEKKSENT